MLVLTRKSEEKIVIGKKNQIVITILKIQGDKVSVGIEAPDDEPIMRKELLLRDTQKPLERNPHGEARRRNKEAFLQLQSDAQKKQASAIAMAEIKSEPQDDYFIP
jgi:carbon storage regulator